MREFEIEIDNRTGGKEKVVIVTTLTDPTIPQKEILDLYWARWNCELDIRSIKHSLHMNVLRCKTPSMVRKEIWVHMLANNLLRSLMSATAIRHDLTPRQLSFRGTQQMLNAFCLLLTTSPVNQLNSLCADLFDAIGRGHVKVDIGQRFALNDIVSAHLAAEQRVAEGAIVILP
jgi:hypothetical protein